MLFIAGLDPRYPRSIRPRFSAIWRQLTPVVLRIESPTAFDAPDSFSRGTVRGVAAPRALPPDLAWGARQTISGGPIQ
jgi:hypothetical protein